MRSLSFLRPDQLLAMARLMRARCFEPGDRVVLQGAEARSFYLIEEGRAEVYAADELDGGALGPPRLVRTLEAGEYFGELGLLSADGRCTATVIAATDCGDGLDADGGLRCWTLTRDEFRGLLGHEDSATDVVAAARGGDASFNADARCAQPLPVDYLERLEELSERNAKYRSAYEAHASWGAKRARAATKIAAATRLWRARRPAIDPGPIGPATPARGAGVRRAPRRRLAPAVPRVIAMGTFASRQRVAEQAAASAASAAEAAAAAVAATSPRIASTAAVMPQMSPRLSPWQSPRAAQYHFSSATGFSASSPRRAFVS